MKDDGRPEVMVYRRCVCGTPVKGVDGKAMTCGECGRRLVMQKKRKAPDVVLPRP